MPIKIIILYLFSLQMSYATLSTSSLTEQQQEFLALEKLIDQTDKNSQFIQRIEALKDYPLYPYLYYQWLKKNLSETTRIKHFLADYRKTRYSTLLRQRWLDYLAQHQHWQRFIQHYQKTHQTKLQCLYYHALYQTGAKRDALMGAKKLWVVAKSQPKQCNPVFKKLIHSKYFSNEMRWQRFDAALSKGNIKIALYVKGLMSKKDQILAKRWLSVHAKPELILKKGFLLPQQKQAGLIFAQGISQLARRDLAQAIALWDTHKNDYKINQATVRRIEKKLALSLAYRGDKRAYQRLSRLSRVDEKTKEWRVRTALRQQDWQAVKLSINELNKSTRRTNKWQYWLARALENTEKTNVARLIYKQLAQERSFYGYLSAAKLNQTYQLSDRPITVPTELYKRLKNKDDFRAVAELRQLDKPLEAKRQWWYAVGKLDQKRLLAAAKYAQELDWKQIAIFTLAKAKYWDDVSLRFPLGYYTQVQKNATRQQLSPAIILGLIRRESAFNKDALSPVGARGLMQIMPKTGKQIARELKEKWKSTHQLLDPDVNVKYGTYYYKQLLNQFKGHYALAAAAYNAGPHRVKRWLPEKGMLPADIWIETIPFKETRAYVSAVLTYALIYQQKLKQNILSMENFMRDVVPG